MPEFSNMKVMVEVKCKCGNLVNIRGRGTRKSVMCWSCNRVIGYEIRGWMSARGYYVDDFAEIDTITKVISMESG